MGVGVISSNVSLKVSGSVSSSRTTTGNFFTCAANSYAIINIHVPAGGSSTGSVTVDGKSVFAYNTSADNQSGPIYVGPLQAVELTVSSGAATVAITGVQFINSP